MDYKNILVSTEEYVQIITINRPEKLNALNIATLAEIKQAFVEAEVNKSVKVVIMTGAGEKAFVAGADISEFHAFSVEKGAELSADGHVIFNSIENLSKPVIAAINGFALGGGLELAMAAHIRICSSNAKMGLPEVSLGVIPGYGGTQRLVNLVGKAKACEMIFTAGMVDALAAKSIGLVNEVVELGDLLATCKKMAVKIMRNSPVAIGAAIRSVNAVYDKTRNGYDVEIAEFGKCFGTDDFKEGTDAFLNKRKPDFIG